MKRGKFLTSSPAHSLQNVSQSPDAEAPCTHPPLGPPGPRTTPPDSPMPSCNGDTTQVQHGSKPRSDDERRIRGQNDRPARGTRLALLPALWTCCRRPSLQRRRPSGTRPRPAGLRDRHGPADGEGRTQHTWFERHGSTPITEIPSHWPDAYRKLVERRIRLIETNKEIGLIERAGVQAPLE